MVVGLDDKFLHIVEPCVTNAKRDALPVVCDIVRVELSEPYLTTKRFKNLLCVASEDEFRIVKNHATSAMFSSQS
jgi:hypothetical protein